MTRKKFKKELNSHNRLVAKLKKHASEHGFKLRGNIIFTNDGQSDITKLLKAAGVDIYSFHEVTKAYYKKILLVCKLHPKKRYLYKKWMASSSPYSTSFYEIVDTIYL